MAKKEQCTICARPVVIAHRAVFAGGPLNLCATCLMDLRRAAEEAARELGVELKLEKA
jgi:hypothetical protein